MSEVASHLTFLRDPRLAAHATSAAPVWLWNTDATGILWANPVGAAIFGATMPAAIAERRFDPREQAAAQIARLLGTLRLGGAARLERLRGFGTGFWRTLLCSCSRITLADHTAGVLVVATEPAGPALSLAERVRRLYEGTGLALAAFTSDGNLIHTTPEGRARLGNTAKLSALGADTIAADALALGHATGDTPLGRLIIERLGANAHTAVVAIFAAASAAAPAQSPAREEPPQREVVAPPTVPAPPAAPEAPPVVPDMPAPSGETPARPAEAPTRQPAAERSVPPLHIDVPIPERRHPLRFVWQMDANGRFTLGSDEFTEVIGPRVAIALGRPWNEINRELALDPENQVARAIATRDTWSGITVSWPVDGSADRLKVELSGLPIYDRNRNFLGYRGFGVCRDVERIATLAVMRRSSVAAGAAPRASTGAPTGPAFAAEAASAPASEARPALSVVPTAPNVVPFRAAVPAPEPKSPTLSPVERNAFHELARQLSARLKGDAAPAEAPVTEAAARPLAVAAPAPEASPEPTATDEPASPPAAARVAIEAVTEPAAEPTERPLLDRIPIGILVYRLDTLLYANCAFLDWTGHQNLDALVEAGGLDSLFVESGGAKADDGGRTLTIATPRGDTLPVEGRLLSIPWEGESALALMLVNKAADDKLAATEMALRLAEAQLLEFRSILDTATDSVIVVEPNGRIASANRGAEALFGFDAAALTAKSFVDLFAPESREAALDYLAAIAGAGRPINEGREITAQARQGTIPLFVTLGRIADDSRRVCAIFRDVTPSKKAERDLVAARQDAERESAAKSDFLAKVSHEIRTPLNSIVGFTEVMLEERFGPIGNERYRDYLKDIRSSGDHVVSLLNDLLDLSKIESGKLELSFASLNLNELVQSCVALMQPQANRERIIIRTSLSPSLRPVVADARSVRQIVLNLLSNSIKFTGAGGQVIVSTALSAAGEVVLRLRDTGIGMGEKELTVALEPFRQLATAARWGSSGTGLGLPLTKALAEANRAHFTITSKLNDGTLVEVAFPATRVLAE